MAISVYSFYIFSIRTSRKESVFVIYTLAASLLLHTSLITNFIVGWDIHSEYHFSMEVLASGFWNPSFPNFTNSVISTVIFSPVISLVTGLSLTWTYKLVYPLVYATVPSFIYILYDELLPRTYANAFKLAGPLLFTYIFIFYNEMVGLGRQMVAEVFLVIFLYLLVRGRVRIRYLFVSLLMLFSIVVSHYSTAFYLLVILLIASVLYSIFFVLAGGVSKAALTYKNRFPTVFLYIIIIIVFIIEWYSYASSGNFLVSIAVIGKTILSTLPDLFTSPGQSQAQSTTQAAGIFFGENSLLHAVNKYLQILSQVLIVVGFGFHILTSRDYEGNRVYYAFLSAGVLLFLLLSLLIPRLSSSLNTTRLYHISLIFISVYFGLGFMALHETLTKLIPIINVSLESILTMAAAFLFIFLLLNSGLLYEIIGNQQTSQSLSRNTIMEHGTDIEKVRLHNEITTQYDHRAATWIQLYRIDGSKVTTGYPGLTAHSYGRIRESDIIYPNYDNNNIYYMFKSYVETVIGRRVGLNYTKGVIVFVEDREKSSIQRIYANGNATISARNSKVRNGV
jgi:uncharacterized membrane protein